MTAQFNLQLDPSEDDSSSANQAISAHLDTWNDVVARLQLTSQQQSKKSNCILLNADSRTALTAIAHDSVDCIITSPPYGGLKDYGSTNQIGFGQHPEDEYLPDLKNILADLLRVAKPGAALWIVLDTLKEAGETVPLPWEVITRAKEVGWTFHDLVIWDKGKSLPWSNHGRFRGVCEYILLLGNGKLTHFNLDASRDADNLSPYWVKYPERYHPDGKAPSDLWHFPIPTQGSWSKGQSRHYCPFPIGLVARMISITSKIGDTILDPFSGTGSVIAVASHMKRYGIGIELNNAFVEEFDQTGYHSLVKLATTELGSDTKYGSSLRSMIIDLRMLKYAKTLFLEISRGDRLSGQARNYIDSFLLRSTEKTSEDDTDALVSGNLGRIELDVLLREGADTDAVQKIIIQRMSVAPLTLFGINVDVRVASFDQWNTKTFLPVEADTYWYIYRNGKFYSYSASVDGCSLPQIVQAESNNTSNKIPAIFSKLKISVDSPSDGG